MALFLDLFAFLCSALEDCFILVTSVFHHAMLEHLVPLVKGQTMLKQEQGSSEIINCPLKPHFHLISGSISTIDFSPGIDSNLHLSGYNYTGGVT